MMAKKSKILIVDDEENCLRSIKDVFDLEGLECYTANTGQKALEIFDRSDVDIVITDIRMPGMSGIEVLNKVKERRPATPVLVLTGFGSIEDAVRSIKKGAYNYILKPVNVSDLLDDIREILHEIEQDREVALFQGLPEGKQIIGNSDNLHHVTQLIQKISHTDLPVLILGESGTGKELAAAAIHHSSDRQAGPFVRINCAALPETLLESELFGYEKGAFTDAKSTKKGKVELADKGTLFLDEIGDMAPPMQAKLLRVLEAREVDRLGSNSAKARPVDIRVISATNQDLRDAVEKGVFRNDLYYRLNTITIEMPSLRSISMDIPLLARHFIKEYSTRLGRGVLELSGEAHDLLLKYNWPGNVRELANAMRRAVALCEGGEIRAVDLPEHLIHYEPSPHQPTTEHELSQPLTLAEIEKQHIITVLKKVDGNRSKAAGILGIHRDTLLRKIKQYGLA